MASVTLILVAGFGPGDLHIALWRTTNVIWGGLLAIVCSKYLFPARAGIHFHFLCQHFLSQFHVLYDEHNQNANKQEAYLAIDLSTCKSTLKKLTSLESSVIQELPQDKKSIKEIIGCQTRMFSLLENISQTPWSHQYGHHKIQNLIGLSEAKKQMSCLIEQLSCQFSDHKVVIIEQQSLSILSLYPEIEEGNVRTDISFYGYLWLNRELARQLSSLSKCFHQLNINYKQ